MIAIFDWDGTLCDSIDHIVDAMQDAAVELELIPPTVANIRDIVGLGLPQAISQLFPALDDAQRSDIAAAYSRHFVAPSRAPAQLFAGAMHTLEVLRGRGVELAVATGKSRRGLNRVLATLGMDDFFDATRCADETRSKPHPMMLHEIMAERGKSVTDAVVIGDSEYDLGMAQRAGVSCVAVSFGVHGEDRLMAYGPLAIVHELPALLELGVFNR
jgi:phosphoglycolate phosphatase